MSQHVWLLSLSLLMDTSHCLPVLQGLQHIQDCRTELQLSSKDTEGRFPSSPSDKCHSADLMKATVLCSVQIRAHPVLSAICCGKSHCVQPREYAESTNVRSSSWHSPYMKSFFDDSDNHIVVG
ncbi:hypothetical protein Droror1_Dr00022245 [Drosera rotundifolia]